MFCFQMFPKLSLPLQQVSCKAITLSFFQKLFMRYVHVHDLVKNSHLRLGVAFAAEYDCRVTPRGGGDGGGGRDR